MLTRLQRLVNFSKFQTYSVNPKESVVDFKSLVYRSKEKLIFEDHPETGKRLPLYIWKPKVFTYQRKYLKYNSAFITLAYLIKTNPCTYLLFIPFSLFDFPSSDADNVLFGGDK